MGFDAGSLPRTRVKGPRWPSMPVLYPEGVKRAQPAKGLIADLPSLPRRGNRTQPGVLTWVLTPGYEPNPRPALKGR